MMLVLLGMITVWCWWGIRLLGDVRLRLGAFDLLFAVAFAAYLLALRLVRRWEHRPPSHGGIPWALALIALVAVLGRLVLLETTPTLSDDIYRYRWDGRVQEAGMDPYAYPPNHPTLAVLRDEGFSKINFPHLRTVYPPITELAFRVGVRLGETLTAQKLIFVAAELVTCASLLVILMRRNLSPLWIVAYAWHPLVILEIAGSGHNDALGVAWLWLGLAAWEARRWWGAAAAWSASFLSKFASILLAPWWALRRTHRPALLAFIALSTAPFVWMPNAVSAVWESLSAMTSRFESNASVYLLLASLVRSAALARCLAGVAWGCFLIWWAHRQSDPVRYLGGAVAAAVLLSPVLHPWYLVWLIPCFCFWRPPALLMLTGTVVLAYAVWPGRLADGRWVLPVWAHVLEYAPLVVWGGWEVVRSCVWPSSFRLATKPTPSARC